MLKSQFPLTLSERFDTDTVNAAKGFLILCVIFGHASNFWTPEPFLTFSIKFFHVACFLLFPFIYDIRSFNGGVIKNIIARYYAPFAFFLTGYAIIFFFYSGANIQGWLGNLGKALLFGNAPMLDAASGLRALWFMPVLIAIVALNSLLIGRFKTPLWLLLAFGFLIHITVGIVADPIKYYFPLGLLNAGYLLFIGFLIRYLCVIKSMEYLQKNSHVFLFICFMGIFFSHYFGTLIKFPVLALPDFTDMRALIIHDTIIISAFMFLITTPFLKKLSFLKYCGKNSLTLYLTHLIFLAAGMTITTKYFDVSQVNLFTAFIVFSIFIFSLGGGLLCSTALNKIPVLKNIIMPSNWDEWTCVKIFKNKGLK